VDSGTKVKVVVELEFPCEALYEDFMEDAASRGLSPNACLLAYVEECLSEDEQAVAGKVDGGHDAG
jgi:hypothetical protein